MDVADPDFDTLDSSDSWVLEECLGREGVGFIVAVLGYSFFSFLLWRD